MSVFVTFVHVFVCFALIAIILLQHGKGADIGAAFGAGSSNTVFGSRGAGNFLTKLTTGCVVMFMFTSVVLSYFGAPTSITEIIADTPAAETLEVEEVPASTFPDAGRIGEEAEDGEVPSGFEAIPAPEASEE